MTISLITGTPGSGKSLTMASRLRYQLIRKRPVIANFDVNHSTKNYDEYFHEIPNSELTPERIISIADQYFESNHFREDRVLLVLDECQILFSARSWSQKGRQDWLAFFSQHRKYGIEVWFVTQFDTAIDKNIRLLVEYLYICRKLNNLGWIGFFVNMFALGHPVICRVKFWYPMNKRVGSDWTLGTKRNYDFYDSRKRFGAPDPEGLEGIREACDSQSSGSVAPPP